MNTFTQCEPDSVLTGSGGEHLTDYSMQLKAFGQLEVLEWVARDSLSCDCILNLSTHSKL